MQLFKFQKDTTNLELTKKVNGLEQLVEKLEARKSSLEYTLENIKDENHQLLCQVDNLREQNDQLLCQVDNLREQNEQLLMENRDLIRINKELECQVLIFSARNLTFEEALELFYFYQAGYRYLIKDRKGHLYGYKNSPIKNEYFDEEDADDYDDYEVMEWIDPINDEAIRLVQEYDFITYVGKPRTIMSYLKNDPSFKKLEKMSVESE